MHQHLGLGQRAFHQQVAGPLPGRQALALQGHAEVALQVPLGEQLQFAAQQGLVVGRQAVGHRHLLEGHQGVQRRLEEFLGIGAGEHVQVGLAAKIGQQQEALLDVLGENPRHMHPGLGQQSGDLDEGPAVFLRRRRVHDDQRALARLPAEITAETGVAAGGGQCGGRYRTPAFAGEHGRQTRVQPAIQLLVTNVFRHLRESPRP
ncbi:hypothetical protein D9M71_388760 [compost metagenome]